MKVKHPDPKRLAKRIIFLAYEASVVVGMGRLQAVASMDETRLWKSRVGEDPPDEMDVYVDYGYGRMMKLDLSYDREGVILPDTEPRIDYQSWCRAYPTYEALAQAAVRSLS